MLQENNYIRTLLYFKRTKQLQRETSKVNLKLGFFLLKYVKANKIAIVIQGYNYLDLYVVIVFKLSITSLY